MQHHRTRLSTPVRPTVLAVLATLLTAALGAQAAVSADEAAKLKSSLTPFGAERAGNKDGTIPAWDGNAPKIPAGYKTGEVRPNPFPGDKPVLTISAANMAQYADKLTDGTKALLKKYPSYKLEVYPTRRTGGVAPQWVYDNTAKNAVKAKLVAGGAGVEGAFGGIPFPIPKDAQEALWNHRLAWTGYTHTSSIRVFFVTADGKISMPSQGTQTFHTVYYDPKGPDAFEGYYGYGKFLATAPGYKAGEAILAHETLNPEKVPRNLYQYLVGQRRVRKAPSIAYDTPDFVTSGIGLADEAFNLFGPLDKHELKLVGKKEMYIPYNNTMAGQVKANELVHPNHLNPGVVRWELHRVWEMEATLKPGQRHVVSKRKYYIDEDTWQITIFDGWDAKGELWRTNYSLMPFLADIPAVMGRMLWGGYDLQNSSYYINMAPNEQPYWVKQVDLKPTFFAPETLASEGAR